MAIGISPCPPFVKPNSVPGVLWDGNTAAWYKHNDPVAGVIKDGANRVSFWLDKMGYSIGPELVNQVAWYTAAYWDTFDANWSQVGNTLSSNGNNGVVQKNGFWAVGSTYKITYTVIVIAGTMEAPFDGVTLSGQSSIVSETKTYYYTPGAVNVRVTSIVFNGTITALSIKQVTGNHLLQATAASQPLWSAANGVLFDGVNDLMKATAFALVQPEMIYLVIRQITWGINRAFCDGNAVANRMVVYQNNASPEIDILIVAPVCPNINLILNTLSIVKVLFNGANSFSQVNLTAQSLGNVGVGDGNGFTLGGRYDGAAANYCNIEVKEIIIRRTADNAATQAAIYNYLKSANAVP